MPIKNLSDKRQMPRLGKIHTGVKAQTDAGKTYPKAVDYLVCPPEVQKVFGEKPKELEIMFPVEDPEKFASQFYRRYSSMRGLVCKGDGETCVRMVDAQTGDFAHRDTKEIAMRELPCDGQACPAYQAKECKEVMMLQFLIPKVPGIGIWQLDTGSYQSIVSVNSAVDLIKQVCGRISMIPLKLTLEPREVQIDTERGKVKKTVHCLQVRTGETLAEIQKVAALPGSRVLLPPPDEDKPELLYPEAEVAEEPAEDPDWAAMKRYETPDKHIDKPVDNKSAKPIDKPKAKKTGCDPNFEPAEGGLKTFGDFFQAAHRRFGLNKSEALAKLGKSDTQMGDLWDEWNELKAKMEG